MSASSPRPARARRRHAPRTNVRPRAGVRKTPPLVSGRLPKPHVRCPFRTRHAAAEGPCATATHAKGLERETPPPRWPAGRHRTQPRRQCLGRDRGDDVVPGGDLILRGPGALAAVPVVQRPELLLADAGRKPRQLQRRGLDARSGAKLVTTTLADGRTGQVLDLPSNATAVSPVICVTTRLPRRAHGDPRPRRRRRRRLQRRIPRHQHRQQPQEHRTGPQQQGHRLGRLRPGQHPAQRHTTGWQQMRLVLTGKGNTSNFQIYNLYIDPRLC